MLLRVEPPALPPPTLADARLVGDPEAGSASVLVSGAVVFSFERDEADAEVWVGGEVLTAGRGLPLSEAWLGRAREVAGQALRAAVTAAGAGDTYQCPECSRILCAPELRGAGPVKEGWCGPEHTLLFVSGRALVLGADGVRWLP